MRLAAILFGAVLLPIFAAIAGSLGGNSEAAPTVALAARADDAAGLSGSQPLATTSVLTANCRYGVAGSPDYSYWMGGQTTGVGWLLDFQTRDQYAPIPGAEYVQVIRVLQDRNPVTGFYSPTYTVWPGMTDYWLGALLATNRGALWLIGNEPDRGPVVPTSPNRVQDDTFPAVYAKAYHDVYAYIKARDPSAQVGIAGLVEVTPGRLNYLDQVWAAYQANYGTSMPVDVWNMHIYILPEANHDGTAPNDIASVAKGTPLALAKRDGMFYSISPEAQAFCYNSAYTCFRDHDDLGEFAGQVVAMRLWMQGKGQQNKPLILSEYGILYPNEPLVPDYPGEPNCWVYDEFGNCFTPLRAAKWLSTTFAYLNETVSPNLGYPLDGGRLVQQWMWFGMNYPLGYVANIVTPTTPMTFSVVGQRLLSVVGDQTKFPQSINLVALRTEPLLTTWNGPTKTVNVKVVLTNNGSIAPDVPVTIAAYSDAARTILLGTGTVTGLRGCARREYEAVVSWVVPAAQTGLMNYWLTINPGNPIGETSMADNYLEGAVSVTLERLLLPVIRR